MVGVGSYIKHRGNLLTGASLGGKMRQFLIDSVYDWIHRHDKFGQSDFEGWWLVRRVEFLRLIDCRSKDDQTYT